MAAPPSVVTYAGWVYKEGSLVKNWKKRFLVVKGTELAYYKTADHQSSNAQLMGSMKIARVERAPQITNGLLVHGIDSRVLKILFDRTQDYEKCFQAISDWCDPERVRARAQAQNRAAQAQAQAQAPRGSMDNNSRASGWRGQQYTGWLYKQGSQFPVWNRRYFVLEGGMLTYSVGPNTEVLGSNRVLGVRRDSTKAFTLAIMLESGRELRVTGSSEVDISEWQRALRQALQGSPGNPRSSYSASPSPPPQPPMQQSPPPPYPAPRMNGVPQDPSWNVLFAKPDEEDTSPRELQHLPSFGDRIQITDTLDDRQNHSFVEYGGSTAVATKPPAAKPFSPKAPGRGTILEMRLEQNLIDPKEAERVRESLSASTTTTTSTAQNDLVVTSTYSLTGADDVVDSKPPTQCCCILM